MHAVALINKKKLYAIILFMSKILSLISYPFNNISLKIFLKINDPNELEKDVLKYCNKFIGENISI